MAEETEGRKFLNRLQALPLERRAHWVQMADLLLRACEDDSAHCVLLFSDDEDLAICGANTTDMDMAEIIAKAHALMPAILTEDAPPSDRLN